MCDKNGTRCKDASRIPLEQAIGLFGTSGYTSNEKEWNRLIFNGYNNELQNYERKEENITHIDTIFLDVDNPQCDKDILNKFHEEMEKYWHLTYETYSSTNDRPKFRAILLLDKPIKWEKAVKESIFNTFKGYADEKASWFFAPSINKIETIDIRKGESFPSTRLEKEIARAKEKEVWERNRIFFNQLRYENHSHDNSHNDYHNLPSVKHCLNGLVKGERDSSIHAACYAMNKNGYSNQDIHEFIDSLVGIPNDMKTKFKNRYR